MTIENQDSGYIPPQETSHEGDVGGETTDRRRTFGSELRIGIHNSSLGITNATVHDLAMSPSYRTRNSLLPYYTQQNLIKNYQDIFPDLKGEQIGKSIDAVHVRLYGILWDAQPKNIQANIVEAFARVSPEEKLILANTLADLLGSYTYNHSVLSGREAFVTANTEDVFGAFQSAVRTRMPVEAGMCVQIHTAVAEILQRIGVPSALVQVIKTDNGSGGGLHAVTMMQLGGKYIITDYGKTYVAANRDEAIKKYEEVNRVAGVKHFITDQSGRIIATMQTPRGELLDSTFSSRTLDLFLRDAILPEGVSVEVYGSHGEKYGGIEARKFLGDFYIQGKAGKSAVVGARDGLSYKSIGVGIDSQVTSRFRVGWEHNRGDGAMTFDGEKSNFADNIFRSTSLNAAYDMVDTETLKIEAGIGGDAIRQLKRKSMRGTDSGTQERQIGSQNRIRSGIQLSYDDTSGTRYYGSLGVSGELDTKNLGDPNRANPKSKIVDPRRSIAAGIDTIREGTKVSALIGYTRSNIANTLEFSLSSERGSWSGDITGKKIAGRGVFGSPESIEVGLGGSYKINDTMSLQARITQKRTDGAPTQTQGSIGSTFTF